MIKHGSRAILEYRAHNNPVRTNEFEKHYLSPVWLLFESMGFEVDLGPLEKVNASRDSQAGDEHDIEGRPTQPQSSESSVGCIVC